MSGKRSFGSVRKLPSGKYQSRFRGPDGRRHGATFDRKAAAEAWLRKQAVSIDEARAAGDDWQAPAARASGERAPMTLARYAETWLADRDLKPRTRAHYRRLLDGQILPALGDLQPRHITPDRVRAWHASLGGATPTLRAHAYSLLRTILATAVQDRLLDANPCHIRGAGNAKRVHKVEPATLQQLEALVQAMPERYRPMVLLAAWCSLRFGELTELRRKDVDLANGVIKVRRGVTRVGDEYVVGTPKSAAGVRDVAIPPHLIPMLREHLAGNITGGREGLLFPAADGTSHMAPSTLYRVFYPARDAAGRPDLRWHDLRHTGAVLAAQTGATLAELMGRLGHSTPGAALIYQHAAKGRDAEIAAALSKMAGGTT